VSPREKSELLLSSPSLPAGGNFKFSCSLPTAKLYDTLFQNFQFSKVDVLDGFGEDIPFSQNARPLSVIPPEIKSYFSLNPDGKPMKTVLKPHETKNPRDEDWETDDFIIIPDLKERYN
jgi:hypothetical protein